MRRVSNTASSILSLVLLAPVLLSDDPSGARQNSKQPIKLPISVDLRPKLNAWGLLPRSQGARNTCSVFVTTSALEFAVSKHFGRGTPLSVEYLNWACNQVIKNEKEDRGQFFHDLLKGFEQYGISLDKDMPYQKHFDPRLKPSAEVIDKAKRVQSLKLQVHWINPWNPKPGLSENHLREIKTVLARGYPVAAGSSHSRLLVGYSDNARQPGGGIFLTKDSGSGGYSMITYDFAKVNIGDVFWVEASAKPSSTNTPGK